MLNEEPLTVAKGDPDGLHAELRHLEAKVFAAVESFWPGCIVPLLSEDGPQPREDDITRQLVWRLRRCKAIPGRIHSQHEIFGKDPRGRVKKRGQIDFVLMVGRRYDTYLACECKKLNVPDGARTRGRFGEYITEGANRFVTGKYAKGLPLAMMLAYVMNADLQSAYRGVRDAFARALSVQPHGVSTTDGGLLRFRTTIQTSAGGEDGAGDGVLPNRSEDEEEVRQARHQIEVVHTFLPWPQAGAGSP